MKELILRDKVKKVIDIYCQNELTYFKNNLIIREINDLAVNIGFTTKCSLEKLDDYSKICLKYRIECKAGIPMKIYKSDRTVFEQKWIKEATSVLISIDRKERVNFISWDHDSKFVVALIYMLEELTRLNGL